VGPSVVRPGRGHNLELHSPTHRHAEEERSGLKARGKLHYRLKPSEGVCSIGSRRAAEARQVHLDGAEASLRQQPGNAGKRGRLESQRVQRDDRISVAPLLEPLCGSLRVAAID
jgi:hypothetical protein